MFSNPYLPGYLIYLCEILVPGLGIGELLDAWHATPTNLLQRIGYVIGIGLAFDTAVLAIRTSGIAVGGFELRGLDVGTIYLIIGVGAVALLAAIAIRRRFLFPTRPTPAEIGVLVVVASLGVVIALFVQKYPIFPEYPRPDFGIHVEFAEGLASGQNVTLWRGILYFGVHFQLASALVLVGGIPMATAAATMGLLVVLSPFLVYMGAARIFSSTGAAAVAVVLYVFSGAVWYDSVLNSGLYANFFGSLIVLFLLVALLDLSERFTSPKSWALFLLAVFAAYFSHYTTITILPVIMIVSLVQLVRRKSDFKRLLIPSSIAIAPAAIAVVAHPRIVILLLYLASSSGGAVSGSTTLSSALAFFPALGYLAFEYYDDIGFVLLVAFAAVYLYRGVRAKNSIILLIPAMWFAALLIAAPFGTTAWRYSYEALLPLVLMAGYGIYTILPKPKIQRRRTGESNALRQYAKVVLVLLVLLAPVVIGSWGTSVISDATSDSQVQSGSQQNIYSAMVWLSSNTPAGSSYLSLTDWRFSYTYLFIGHNTTYLYVGSEDTAITYAQENDLTYIIVTHLTTVSLPLAPQDYPWYTFQNSSNATLVYSNSDVKIFQIA